MHLCVGDFWLNIKQLGRSVFFVWEQGHMNWVLISNAGREYEGKDDNPDEPCQL